MVWDVMMLFSQGQLYLSGLNPQNTSLSTPSTETKQEEPYPPESNPFFPRPPKPGNEQFAQMVEKAFDKAVAEGQMNPFNPDPDKIRAHLPLCYRIFGRL